MIPPITDNSTMVIHPTYVAALSLKETLVNRVGDDVVLRRSGIVAELPESTSLRVYNGRINALQTRLSALPCGDAQADDFEKVAEEALSLCLFRALNHFERKSRDVAGKVIRDIIAANYSQIPFWEMLRQKYGATQIIFECKNYKELHADDFQQVSYYMNDRIGKVAFLVHRGSTELKRSYLEHIKRVHTDKGGIVLLLGERDMEIFLRQALNGKKSEAHLQNIFDTTIREIS